MGFAPVGVYRRVGYKSGAWHDVGWWQRDLLVRDGEPEEPLTMAAVRARPDFAPLVSLGVPLIRGDRTDA